MEEELRDKKAQKDYYNMVDFVANAQQGIPKLCPCGSITKETVDEEDTYDYLLGKRYFICKDFEVCTVINLVLFYGSYSNKYLSVFAEWRAAF